MSASRAFRPLAALGAAFLLVIGGGSVAYADGLTLDGDGLTPVGDHAVSLQMCEGEATEFDVLITARRNGDTNLNNVNNTNSNVFANSSSVRVSLFLASDKMFVTFSGFTIALPTDWQTAGTGAGVLTASVQLPAQTMNGSGDLYFEHDGVNNAGATVGGLNRIGVSWTVEECAPSDTTPPVLTLPILLPVEATGPDGAAVTWTAPTATDETSPSNPAVTCDRVSGSIFPLGDTLVTCQATDDAGNMAEDSFTVTVVDTKPPAIEWVVPAAEGTQYYFGAVPAFSCTADDIVDGEVACVVDAYPTTVGVHLATAEAGDSRGNAGTSTRSYEVLAWTLHGFSQPVEMGDDVINTVKGGSTVPLKFEVFAGSTELTTTSAVTGFAVTPISCPGSDVLSDPVLTTVTGGTILRYDATAGQFIQNWQTPKKSGQCYQATITTQDGSELSADFKLK